MLVKDLKGIGPKKNALLEKMNIISLSDMLSYYPFSYEDRSHITQIADIRENTDCLIKATVTSIRSNYIPGRKNKMLRLRVDDGTGSMDIIFFNAMYYQNSIHADCEYEFYGRAAKSNNRLSMVHPEFKQSEEQFKSEILPVYSTSKGLSQKDLRNIASESLSCELSESETLPANIIEKNKLCSHSFAVRNIHFPESNDALEQARHRLIYEELFFLQTGLFIKGNGRCREEIGIEFPHDTYMSDFADSLKFQLTSAQLRTLREIESDMESKIPMQRLIQGDVGSGKTVIAAAAMYKSAMNGYQSVMMAPTELLAAQHYSTFQPLFSKSNLRIELLTSSIKSAEKKRILSDLADGKIDILLGTHAVIQPTVEYSKLGLVVTDEQHRFGVGQRTALTKKGLHPDVIVMTATPIPRTLAVIIFGDLDMSVIDERPPGRQPIITKAVAVQFRDSVYRAAKKEIDAGRQVYVVAPLISDSEVVEAASAESVFDELSTKFSQTKIGLLHGAMTQEKKDAVMTAFSEGQIQILVATVVIEVGIDVPQATVMIIENAERFGLAQLHQLRGRVGRGTHQSYCYLVTDTTSQLGRERAKVIASTNDGFEIAEKDLSMRGPGDFFGTRQHGLPHLQIADLAQNIGLLNDLRDDVKEILQEDPLLEMEKNKLIAEGVDNLFKDVQNLNI